MSNLIYTINKLEIAPLENQLVNVVKTVHYSAKMNDGIYEAEIINSVNLASPNPNQFIAYDSLSEEVVIGWIKNFINEDSIKSALEDKITSLKNPTVYQDPPWINNPTN